MLSRLIYASKETDVIGYNELNDIRQTSSRRNSEQGVTGLLLFGSGWFLQALEGERAIVSQTFLRIAHDSRHEQPQLMDMGEIAERTFQDWGMNFVMLDTPMSDRSSSILLRFGAFPRFLPFDMSARSALLLLGEMDRCFAPGRVDVAREPGEVV